PSGIGWVNNSLSTDLYFTNASANFVAYALDPSTLSPIAVQTVRQGITAALEIQTDRPDVAIPASPSVSLPNVNFVTLRNISAGDAILTIVQPPGFSKPASRQRLMWHVAKVPL